MFAKGNLSPPKYSDESRWASGMLALATSLSVLIAVTCPADAGQRSRRVDVESPEVKTTLMTLETQLREGNSQHGIPAMSAAIVDREGAIWTCGVGVTDSVTMREVTSSTMFSLQSISKMVTTTAIMIAVQDGLLDLDEPITTYLPDFKVNSRYEKDPAEKITLRLLLSHRAGFTHEAPYGSNFTWDQTSFDKHIRSISRTWLRYPVGSRYAYSNLGIDLAGYILQVVSGLPFSRFVHEALLEPLGLRNTSYDWDVIEESKNRALGYDKSLPEIPLRHALIPCGGCFSSVEDMAEFIRFHLNDGEAGGKRILDPRLLEAMYEMQNPYEDQVFGYGLGTAKGCVWGETIYASWYLSHSGSGFGFNSSIQWFPEFGLGAAVLASGGSSYFANEMAHNLLKFAISQIGELRTKQLFTGIDSLGCDGRWLNDWIGSYMNPEIVVIAKEDSGYSISEGKKDGLPLTPISQDEAYYRTDSGFVTRIRFVQPESGQPKYIVKLHRGDTYDYNYGPDDPLGPDKAEWSKYIGEYELIKYGKASETLTISVINGYLCIASWRLQEYLPGLFFTAHGEALDFRGKEPTYRNVLLRRRPGNGQ